jgi:hypothetical protein
MSFEEKMTYYDPSETKEFVVVPKGMYKATVKTFEYKREYTNKDNQKADIYEATYTLDSSVQDMTLRDEKGNEVDGSQFVGRSVKSKGFFLWKSPDKDEFVANPAGNKRMAIFLGVMNYPLAKEEIVNTKGTKVEVIKFPETIDETKFIGNPVIIDVDHEEFNGNTYAKEVKVNKWDDAPVSDNKDDEDLPF